jgi:hypothetical protein
MDEMNGLKDAIMGFDPGAHKFLQCINLDNATDIYLCCSRLRKCVLVYVFCAPVTRILTLGHTLGRVFHFSARKHAHGYRLVILVLEMLEIRIDGTILTRAFLLAHHVIHLGVSVSGVIGVRAVVPAGIGSKGYTVVVGVRIEWPVVSISKIVR